MPEGVNVFNFRHMENRGHSFRMQGLPGSDIFILNIYATVSFGDNKVEFLQDIFETVESYD